MSSVDLLPGRIRMIVVPVAIILAAALGVLEATAQPAGFHEDFSGTQYRDASQTTANWDTELQQLALRHHQIRVRSEMRFSDPHIAGAIDVAGSRAYVTTNLATFLIDLHADADPTVTSFVEAPGSAVQFAAGYLYVVDPEGALRVVNVRDPHNPALLATHDCSPGSASLQLAGGYAFVASGRSLQVFDLSVPSRLDLVSTLDLAGIALDVKVSGQRAFIALGAAGIAVVDLHDVHQPRLEGQLGTAVAAEALLIHGDYLYVATGADAELLVLDISSPAAPRILASYRTRGPASAISGSGNRLWVAGHSGIEVLDITDPVAPRSQGGHDSSVTAFHVAGSSAFVLDGPFFRVLDIADLALPAQPVARVESPGDAYEVVISGDYAFVPDYKGGLVVYDISDLSNPEQVTVLQTPGLAVDVAVDGDVVYIADHTVGGIRIIDIQDPRNPVELADLQSTGPVVAIEVSGGLLCVGLIHDGLFTCDVTNPAAPRWLGSVAAGSVRDIAISGSLAYVAVFETELTIVDLADPADPQILAAVPVTGNPTGIALSGSHAFLATGLGGVQIFDVQDPERPRWVSEVRTPGYPFKIDAVGSQLFVADHVAGGLQVIDASDVEQAHVVTGYVTGFYADGVEVAGEHALLTDSRGMQVVRVYRHLPYYDSGDNQARSAVLPTGTGTVVLAALSTVQQGEIRWTVSSDAGQAWAEVPADGTWTAIESPGDVLHWQADLMSDDAVCESLDLQWRYDAPLLHELRSTGSFIEMRWTRSGYDTAGSVGFLYEIEQLIAAGWEPVGTVPGIGDDEYRFRLQETAADGDAAAQYRVRALTGDGRSFVSVSAAWSPSTVWLSANYPNPFRSSTEIFYDLPAGGGVATLRVYDLRGRLIREFRRDHGGAGRYQIRWSGQDQSGSRVAAGAYFYELEAAGQTKRRKMLLID